MSTTRQSKKSKKKVGVQESLQLNKLDISKGNKKKATKADLLPYLSCVICKGLFRDAHTINEWLWTFCKIWVFEFFNMNKHETKWPKWKTNISGKPLSSVVSDMTMQNIVDILYPEFKKEEDKLRKKLYFEKMESLGINVEETKKQKKDNRTVKNTSEDDSKAGKQINFLLLPSNTLKEDQTPLPALSCQSFMTSEKKDIKYIKRFLASRLELEADDIDIYCYLHKLNDSRELSWVFKMIWITHHLTKMKPEEEINILILHYCKKGAFKEEQK